MKDNNKAPIGIGPKDFWLTQRLVLLEDAIKKRLDCNIFWPIPLEWVEERNVLIEKLKIKKK